MEKDSPVKLTRPTRNQIGSGDFNGRAHTEVINPRVINPRKLINTRGAPRRATGAEVATSPLLTRADEWSSKHPREPSGERSPSERLRVADSTWENCDKT